MDLKNRLVLFPMGPNGFHCPAKNLRKEIPQPMPEYLHYILATDHCSSQVAPISLPPIYVWIGELKPAGASSKERADLMQKLSDYIKLLPEGKSVHSEETHRSPAW